MNHLASDGENCFEIYFFSLKISHETRRASGEQWEVQITRPELINTEMYVTNTLKS